MSTRGIRTLKLVLPLVVVAGAALGAWAMYLAREQPQIRAPEATIPLVRVQTVELRDVRLTVRSQGTVSPRTESTLLPEVSGQVIEVSSSFAPGGFFETGNMLLRLDPHDYGQTVIQAEATVAQAELRLAREEAESEIARREWSELGEGTASPLTLREPQLAEARASLAAARAALEQARRNLERTTIRAPYAGRVRSKNVDVGQFVGPGTALARIYAVDYAEVRLPLPDADLAHVELPLDYRGESESRRGPEVVLTAEFAGKVHTWRGHIVRTEGEIDPRSRMVHTVARVENPYGRGSDPQRPPLAAGMFVEAELLGRVAPDAAVLPRTALRGDRVLIVDQQERLRFRDVEVVRRTRDEAIIGAGLEAGDRVCLSNLTAVSDGMQVRVEPVGRETG